MSDNLYTSRSDHGSLRVDHVEKALHHEKLKGNLHVDSTKIAHFTEEFGKALEERRGRIGHQVTPREVEDTLDYMKRNKSDRISDSDIEHFREVLANHDYDTQ